RSCELLALRSFPTRRSSDLEMPAFVHSILTRNRLALLNWKFGGAAGWNRGSPMTTADRAAVFTRVSPVNSLPALNSGIQLWAPRSEEHTSELQSLAYLVCRL